MIGFFVACTRAVIFLITYGPFTKELVPTKNASGAAARHAASPISSVSARKGRKGARIFAGGSMIAHRETANSFWRRETTGAMNSAGPGASTAMKSFMKTVYQPELISKTCSVAIVFSRFALIKKPRSAGRVDLLRCRLHVFGDLFRPASREDDPSFRVAFLKSAKERHSIFKAGLILINKRAIEIRFISFMI